MAAHHQLVAVTNWFCAAQAAAAELAGECVDVALNLESSVGLNCLPPSNECVGPGVCL